ncbi:MAG: phosphotransferase enzyme family protein, partial [Gammaproteobacteria bacterium]
SGQGLAGDPDTLRKNFRTIGELCARVHNQSSAWRFPDDFQRHAWDAQGLTGENPLWGRFWELEILTTTQRDLIQRTRKRVHRELMACPQSPDSYGIIHADLTPENIMVHDGRVRLIDFDDAGFGWHLFEIATALYFHLHEAYFQNARDALIEGYRVHRQLADEMLDRLPLFFVARSFTYLGWIHTRKGTQTAMELGPMLVEAACDLADDYLQK